MRYFHFNKNTVFSHRTQGKSRNKEHLHIWRSIDECELFFVVEGDVYIEQGGEKFHLQKGDYLITEQNVDYGGYKPITGAFHWVHFVYNRADAYFSDEEGGSDFCLPKTGHIEESGSFTVLLVLMQQYSLNLSKKPVMDHLLGALLRDLWVTVTTKKRHTRKDERFQPILDYFHQNPYYNEVHDLKSMAEFFGFSEKYLIRLFKRNTGQSPLQYLTGKKIQRAQEMLADTDMTVKAIATTLHYDYYYFMRLFRKKTGMTPNQFRNTIVPDCTVFVEEDKKK